MRQDDDGQYSQLPCRANTHLRTEGKELRVIKAAFDELGTSVASDEPCDADARIQSWLKTIENNLKAAFENNSEDDGNNDAP